MVAAIADESKESRDQENCSGEGVFNNQAEMVLSSFRWELLASRIFILLEGCNIMTRQIYSSWVGRGLV